MRCHPFPQWPLIAGSPFARRASPPLHCSVSQKNSAGGVKAEQAHVAWLYLQMLLTVDYVPTSLSPAVHLLVAHGWCQSAQGLCPIFIKRSALQQPLCLFKGEGALGLGSYSARTEIVYRTRGLCGLHLHVKDEFTL